MLVGAARGVSRGRDSQGERRISSSPATQPRVLIVDDAARIHDLLVELLTDEGYPAVAVANGQAALDYLHTHPAPCCIILDLYMPS